MEAFDAIFIGTGQANPSLAGKFAEEGKKIAIVEENLFGGSCVNYGCTPTKALVANAKIVHSVKIGSTFGVNVHQFHLDFSKVQTRKDQIRDESENHIEKFLKNLDRCTVFEKHGEFESPHRIRVGNQVIEGEKIFIDVGAKTHIPPLKNLEKIPYLTNVSLLDIQKLPKKLLILGGGYIGLEFAQVFKRLGSEVSVFQRSSFVMPKEDEDIAEAIREILQKEGIQIYTNAQNFEILSESKEENILVQFDQNGEKVKKDGSHLLIATGRVPNTKNLGLEKAGVEVDQKGFIIVDDFLKTTQDHIWALGDCNGKGAFTHTSYNDFQIAYDHLFKNGNRKVSDRIPIYALFTDPPLGRVGKTEKEALQQNKEIWMAKMPMEEVSRAKEKGETEGFLKILVNPSSKEIIGASFLGTDCDEVIHMIAMMMYAKAPYTLFEKAVLTHPTVSEFIPSLLSKLEPIKTFAKSG